MQFTHQDFYSNFTASLKSGDLDLTSDIFANEISDFIVFDTEKIIGALNNADIKITSKDSDEEIVDAVIKNLSDNTKLKKTLAFIIAEGNELINTSTSTDKAKQLQIINDIASGLTKVNNSIIADAKGFKDETMGQVVSKAASTKEYKRTIWKKDKKDGKVILYWTLIGVGLAVTIYIIYRRQKKAIMVSQPLPNMAGLGNAIQPTTVQSPVTAAPAAPVV